MGYTRVTPVFQQGSYTMVTPELHQTYFFELHTSYTMVARELHHTDAFELHHTYTDPAILLGLLPLKFLLSNLNENLLRNQFIRLSSNNSINARRNFNPNSPST